MENAKSLLAIARVSAHRPRGFVFTIPCPRFLYLHRPKSVKKREDYAHRPHQFAQACCDKSSPLHHQFVTASHSQLITRHLPSSFTSLTGTVCCRPFLSLLGSRTWHRNVASPALLHFKSVTRCTFGLLSREPTNICSSGNCFTAVSASAIDGGTCPQPLKISAAAGIQAGTTPTLTPVFIRHTFIRAKANAVSSRPCDTNC